MPTVNPGQHRDPNPIRVLRIYHSAVVDEYRERERALRREYGYDVHLVAPPAWSEGGSMVNAEPDDDPPLHVVDVRGRHHPILFWYDDRALRAVLREVRPHIVDVHEEPYSLSMAGVLWALRRESPDSRVCIYTAQNIHKRYPPPFRQFERRALAAAAAAYPCSTEAGDVLRRKGFRGPLHVIPLGVSLESPREREARSGLRVGFAGRLEPYKGADVALRAFALATADLDAGFELLGSGSAEPALRALAAELGIAPRVRFVGSVPQPEALRRIGDYDVLVIPSLTTQRWKEQFGRVAVQAMAAGTPVIASDSGSLPEVVGDAGEVTREGDIDDLAVKLRGLLGDGALRAELAERGRRRAAEHFSWTCVAAGCARMYREVLGLCEAPNQRS